MISAYFATNCDARMMSVPSVNIPLSTRYAGSWRSDSHFKLLITPEDFIGLELSLIPQVERVFVTREENGKGFKILTVVNDRDPDLRARIYTREQAIIDAWPHFDFDFHITARMNRNPDEVTSSAGKLAYLR